MTDNTQGAAGPQGEQGERGPRGERGFGIFHPRFLVLYIAILVSGVAIISAINTQNIARSNNDNIQELRQAQINNCEASKKPGGIRWIIADQLKRQLAQNETFDYKKFFPNIPPKQLNALLKQQKVQTLQEIDSLLNIDCSKLYPQVTSP